MIELSGFVGDNAFRLNITAGQICRQPKRSQICLVKTLLSHGLARSEWMVRQLKQTGHKCNCSLPPLSCHHSSLCQEDGCYSSTCSYWVFMKSCLCQGNR